MDSLKVDGSKNTITFSIAIPDPNFPGNPEMIKGLLVWVDDVYLKKNITPDNLFVNGDLEQSEELNTSAWYEKNKTHFDCGVSSLIPNDLVYPDGTPLESQPPLQISTQVDLTTIDRKSGRQSIILKLPRFTFPSCSTYYGSAMYPDPSQPQGVLISAATDIDFTDFLMCTEYINSTDPQKDYDPLPTTGTLPQGGKYFVAQNCTLNGTLTFNDNIVTLHPGVAIIVQNNDVLKIQDATGSSDHTILFGCENMWQGIIVEQDGGIDLKGDAQNKSEITDAVIGIDAHGISSSAITNRFFRIQDIIFDQNNTAIQLTGTYLEPDGNNIKTFINSTEFKCKTGVITKAPHYNKFPSEHINLINVTGLTNNTPFPLGYFGSLPSAAYINYYSDATAGIRSLNSRYDVYRSDFTKSPASTTTTTFGIYAVGQPSVSNNSIRIIPNLNNDGTIFSNLNSAISTNTVESFTSIGNSIDNCAYGIKCKEAVDVKIDDNTINNFLTGIGVYDIDVRSTYNFKQILNNKLNVGIPLDQLSHYGMTGIDIQNIITHTSPITISKNTIYNSAIGIHGRNATNLTIGVDAGNFNRITDEMPLDNTFHYGIWMENSSFARINNNEVEWTGGTVNDPAFLRTHTGIGISRSLSCTVTGNTIINYGGGFKIFEDCSQTELRCNTMDHCYHGVYFDVNGMNNLISPNQGVYTGLPANDVSWNNRWLNTISGINKVDGSVPTNTFIRWVYDINSTIEFDPNPSAGFVDRKMGNSHINCP